MEGRPGKEGEKDIKKLRCVTYTYRFSTVNIIIIPQTCNKKTKLSKNYKFIKLLKTNYFVLKVFILFLF